MRLKPPLKLAAAVAHIAFYLEVAGTTALGTPGREGRGMDVEDLGGLVCCQQTLLRSHGTLLLALAVGLNEGILPWSIDLEVRTTMELDQVIAGNVTRLREAQGWTMQDLADRLDVRRHDVLAYEGRKADRPQRSFRWPELVSLCYAFKVTLYELVLPADSHTEVREPALLHFPVGEVAFGFGWPRRAGLGLRLFGISGDVLLEEVTLKRFETYVQEETERTAEEIDRVTAGIAAFVTEAAITLERLHAIDFRKVTEEHLEIGKQIGERRPGMTNREMLERYPDQSLAEVLQSIIDEDTEE